MKKILQLVAFGILGLSAALVTHAQVQCSLAVDPPAASLKAGDKFTVRLAVQIDPGWHINSLSQPEGGPVRSEILLPKGQPFKLAGKITAPEPDRQHSDTYNIDVETYEGSPVFVLPLEITDALPPNARLKVEFTYQACTEENNLAPETEKLEVPVAIKPTAHGKSSPP